MNASDLARLELAKRAFLAAQPRASEVQAGVRRARLGLRRPKRRRSWFGKGLVLVVLAVSGLAYAKPHAVSEALSALLERAKTARAAAGLGHIALTPSSDAGPAALTPARSQARSPAESASLAEATPAPSMHVVEDAAPTSASPAQAAPTETKLGAAEAHAARPAVRGSAASTHQAASRTEPVVSEWGRVGQALARGDEARALTLLGELAESDEPRTRDNADLGRARLLLSHGESARACAIARELSAHAVSSNVRHQAELVRGACERELSGESPAKAATSSVPATR